MVVIRPLNTDDICTKKIADEIQYCKKNWWLNKININLICLLLKIIRISAWELYFHWDVFQNLLKSLSLC